MSCWGNTPKKSGRGMPPPVFTKPFTLFMTKICHFPYPIAIYDLTKKLISYLWPDP